MSVSEYCNRDFVAIAPENTALDAAKLMRKHGIHSLIVVEENDGLKKPLGLLDDAALVREVMAKKADAETVTVATLMQAVDECARLEEPVWTALERMRRQHLRRLPVIDAEGGLVGELMADDILALLTAGIVDITALLRGQADTKKKPARRGARKKPARRTAQSKAAAPATPPPAAPDNP